MNEYILYINKEQVKNKLNENIIKNINEYDILELNIKLNSKKSYKYLSYNDIIYNDNDLSKDSIVINSVYDMNDSNCPFLNYFNNNLEDLNIELNEDCSIKWAMFFRKKDVKLYIKNLENLIEFEKHKLRMNKNLALLELKNHSSRYKLNKLHDLIEKINLKQKFNSIFYFTKLKIFIRIDYKYIFKTILNNKNFIDKFFFLIYHINNYYNENMFYSFKMIKKLYKNNKFKDKLKGILNNQNILESQYFINNFVKLDKIKKSKKSQPSSTINENLLIKYLN